MSGAPPLPLSSMSRQRSLSSNEVLSASKGASLLRTLSGSNLEATGAPAMPAVTSPHFLQGIDMNRTDALCIPSPPSLEKMKRRRLSTPMQALRNLSNDARQNNVTDHGYEKDNTEHSNSKRNSVSPVCKKRSRQSLSHVPMRPSANVELVAPVEGSLSKTAAAATDAKSSSTKRCRKEITLTSLSPGTPGRHVSDSVDIDTPGCPYKTNDILQLRDLIRQYSSLSYKQQKDPNNNVRQAIFQVSNGYYVAPPLPPNIDLDSLPEPDNERGFQNLMATHQKLLAMEESKQNDARTNEQVTGCQAIRSRGKYRYYDRTGRRVPASAYEERYMYMIEEMDAVRDVEWQAYFDELRVQYEGQRELDASMRPVAAVAEVDDETGPDFVAAEPDGKPSSPAAPQNSPHLLAIPNRDAPSSDPGIARAEAKLFSVLDRALEEYSREVMAIRAARAVPPSPSVPELL